jgi:hypothetical protein
MEDYKIDIRPATSVYGTYRRLSYKPSFAVAEFIDNSTQSYFNHKKELRNDKNFKRLVIDIKYDFNEGILEITDNAFGMNFDDFQRALILDKPPKDNTGRNEFGMGLKTAACWFGNLWTVETTELGSNKMFRATMDIKKFESEKIETINPEVNYVPFELHYTKITIKDLNQKLSSVSVRKTKDLLQRIYRNDLRSNEIDIFWNGEKLNYEEIEIYDEDLKDGTHKLWKKNLSFDVCDPYGKTYTVNGWVGIQKEGSYQTGGFALLRRGRVIIGTDSNYEPKEIFGNGGTYQRLYLCGELNLDNFPITQAKDGFMWDNGLEDNFISVLDHEVADFSAKTKYRRNENHSKKVNEFTSIQIDEISSSTVNKFKNINFQEIESNNSEDENHNKVPEIIDFGKDEIDKVSSIREIYNFSVSGYNINVKWDDTNEVGQWVTLNDKGNNEFDITINIRHNFFTPYQNDPEFIELINEFAIALILAEKQAKKSTTDTNQLIEASSIRMYMNKILSQLASIKE